MAINEINVTLSELRSVDESQLISSCESITCYEIEKALGQLNLSNASKILSYACSMHIRPENTKSPFSPKFVMAETRGVLIEDFSKQTLQALAEFAFEVKTPDLKARLLDISWVSKAGGINHAYAAIEAYLDTAKYLTENNASWVYTIERLERALRLSCIFKRENQKPSLFRNVSNYFISEINKNKFIDPPFYVLKLLELSIECGVGESEWHEITAKELAAYYYEKNDTRIALDAWDCALKSANITRNKAKEEESWRGIADCHIKDSKIQEGYIGAGCLLKAIDALSKIPDTRQERLELYELMRDFQLESLHQLSEFSSPPQNITELVHTAKTAVIGKDFFDMLFRFSVLVSRPTNMMQLKEQAKNQMSNSFAWMFGGIHIDHEGMTVVNVPPNMGVNNDQDGSLIWSIMMRNIGIDHQLAVQGQIRPALDEIMTKHYISEYQLGSIFNKHPFIPEGHEYFFIKGISFGLEGDFLSACHVLIPQIENSLRYLIRIRGEEPTTLHGDGSQERNGLKQLLESPIILDILGQNILGNLQAILIDKIYGDLRNQLSHGYMPAGHYFGVAPIFFWWLVLHILMLPLKSYWEERYKE